MIARRALLIGVALLLLGGTGMAPTLFEAPFSRSETDIHVVGLDTEPEYVIGFPSYVAVTVAPRRKGSYFLLPLADFLSLGGVIGVSLVNVDDGTRTARFLPADPHVDPDEPTGASFQLIGTERRRILVDLSPLIPADLGPGIYHLAVGYHEGRGLAWSDWVQVRLRAPRAQDLARLAEVAGDRDPAMEWPAWVQQPPADPAWLPGAVGRGEPLRFVALLRWLLHGPPLATVDPGAFAVLDGIYAPEARALAGEVLRARGDAVGLGAVLAEIDEHHPGLAWWARSLREGDGEIAWRRSR